VHLRQQPRRRSRRPRRLLPQLTIDPTTRPQTECATSVDAQSQHTDRCDAAAQKGSGHTRSRTELKQPPASVSWAMPSQTNETCTTGQRKLCASSLTEAHAVGGPVKRVGVTRVTCRARCCRSTGKQNVMATLSGPSLVVVLPRSNKVESTTSRVGQHATTTSRHHRRCAQCCVYVTIRCFALRSYADGPMTSDATEGRKPSRPRSTGRDRPPTVPTFSSC
jgi:hypothetical protein